jgi:hypothetical protein
MTRDYYLYSGSSCPSCKEGKLKEVIVWNNRNTFLVCSSCNFNPQLTTYWYKNEIK